MAKQNKMGYTQKYGSVARVNSKKAGLGHGDSGSFSKKVEKMPRKKAPSFVDTAKSYFKGEQGLIPDFEGKPTRQAMDESTFFNPKTASERMSDTMDTKMRTSYVEKQNKGQKLSPGEQRSLDHYNAKTKQTRPNRKNRYSENSPVKMTGSFVSKHSTPTSPLQKKGCKKKY